MFNKQPLMMKKIAPLEIAALRWGMRNEFVSEDVIVEFVKTASRQKTFDEHSFKMLEQIYDMRHDKTTLEAMCGILIKDKMYDPRGITVMLQRRISSMLGSTSALSGVWTGDDMMRYLRRYSDTSATRMC